MTFSAVERRPAFSMDAREMPSAMPRRPSSSAAVTALPMSLKSAALVITLGLDAMALTWTLRALTALLALTTRRWPTREEVMEAIFGFVRCRRCVADVRDDVSEIDVDDERQTKITCPGLALPLAHTISGMTSSTMAFIYCEM